MDQKLPVSCNINTVASHVSETMGEQQLREVTHIEKLPYTMTLKKQFMISLSLYSPGLIWSVSTAKKKTQHIVMYLPEQAVCPIQFSHELHTYIF